jgi:hypothetical protein
MTITESKIYLNCIKTLKFLSLTGPLFQEWLTLTMPTLQIPSFLFKFISKLSGIYRDFPYPYHLPYYQHPAACTSSSPSDDPSMGFGKCIYNDMYPSL